MLEVISAGIGIQSTTMMLMAAHGLITPMPDLAIFADTKGESAATYRHLDWLRSGNVLPFPIEVVSFSDLEDDILRSAAGETGIADRKGQYMAPPMRTLNADGSTGMLRRECTKNYKIVPIEECVRRHLGIVGKRIRGKKKLVRQWIGFSADEAIRAGGGVHKRTPKWTAIWYPLIDRLTGDGLGGAGGDRWISLGDCIEWLKRHEYPVPPRSACVFCPYLKNERWRDLRDNHPEGWERALKVDEAVRDMAERGLSGLNEGGTLFLHHSHKPLREADLKDEDPNQRNMWPDFTDECEGMCGL